MGLATLRRHREALQGALLAPEEPVVESKPEPAPEPKPEPEPQGEKHHKKKAKDKE